MAVLCNALTRPLRLLFFHPLIQISAVLSGFSYGILYVVLSTFSELWTSHYHQSVEISGIHYLALALGEVAGSQVGGAMMDFLYRRGTSKNSPPEARILLGYPAIVVSWAGMVAYGWMAERRLLWAAVDVAAFIMMFGMQIEGMPCKYFPLFRPNDNGVWSTNRASRRSDGLRHGHLCRSDSQRPGGSAVCPKSLGISLSFVCP